MSHDTWKIIQALQEATIQVLQMLAFGASISAGIYHYGKDRRLSAIAFGMAAFFVAGQLFSIANKLRIIAKVLDQ